MNVNTHSTFVCLLEGRYSVTDRFSSYWHDPSACMYVWYDHRVNKILTYDGSDRRILPKNWFMVA